MQLKFTVSVHFGAQFTAGKPKILIKTKISAKTASLGIINNASPRSQKNHRILGKLCLKTFFGPKLSLNCHLGSKDHSQILTEPIIGPAIYAFWISSFSFWVFAVFDFSQTKPLRFSSSGPIFAHFWVFLGQ